MSQSLSESQSLADLAPAPDISHLVIEDDTPVDNFLSATLQRLLVEALYSSWQRLGLSRSFLADADIGVFSSVYQPPIVPDVFLSLDVEVPTSFREKQNRTYLIWEFGKPPDVVIEIVSNKQGGELDNKRRDYARIGVAYYVVYDPLQQLGQKTLWVFGLHEGRYVELETPWLDAVGLGLKLWQGEFEGKTEVWLRWCDRAGNLLLTGAEWAEQERQRAEQAEAKAEQAEAKAEQAEAKAEQAEAKAARLADRLRALGIDPDSL